MSDNLFEVLNEIKNFQKEKIFDIMGDNASLMKDFLTFQIYSPIILRIVAEKWNDLPDYLRDNTPKPIEILILSSHQLSDKELKKGINQYLISRAVRVLKGYKNCPVPLPDFKEQNIETDHINLLSSKGEKALTILERAQREGATSDALAKLALRTSHKFLLDLSYYKHWNIPAKSLVKKSTDLQTGEIYYTYPTLQLTKGCVNGCSHCLMRAEAKLSHMPYPMFFSLHQTLWETYKSMPKNSKSESEFYKFFSDSDSLSYHDDIIGADSADVHFNLNYNEKPFALMTRGVTTSPLSRLSLAKLLHHNLPIALSFVDTPLENKERTLKQLNNTLDIADKCPNSKENIHIFHLHLKSGPTYSSDIFRGYSSENVQIYKAGRAKQFPDDELLQVSDDQFLVPTLIEPNGQICRTEIKNLEHYNKPIISIIKQKMPHKVQSQHPLMDMQKEHQKE